jgi:hypothetical protein
MLTYDTPAYMFNVYKNQLGNSYEFLDKEYSV